MTLRTRRLLFYGFFALFLILSYLIILYSQGWRINLEDCQSFNLSGCRIKFQKTGALYIQTQPKEVKITINNKPFADNSGLFKDGTLISELLPRKYKIEIKKEGYFDYIKNAVVEPAKVSEITNTILMPQETEDGSAFPIKLRGDKLEDFSGSYGKFIVKSEKDTYYLYNLDQQSAVLNVNTLFNNILNGWIIKKIKFHPYDGNKLIVEATKNNAAALYNLDIQNLELEKIYTETRNEKIADWSIINSDIYYLTASLGNKKESYSLNLYNLIIKNPQKIADNLNIEQEKGLNIKISASKSAAQIGILNSSSSLFLFNNQNQTTKKLAENVAGFYFSPDSKKLAYFKNNSREIIIYFLQDWQKNIFKKAGESITLGLEKSEEINNIFWYNDSFHLIVGYRDFIDFSEIDNRPPINFYPIIRQAVDKFYYDLGLNSLYFIKNGDLRYLDFNKIID